MKDAASIILKVRGRAWTVHISTEDGITRQDGTQTMPFLIAEAVINTLDQILPYLISSLEVNLERLDTTGLCEGTIKSPSIPKKT